MKEIYLVRHGLSRSQAGEDPDPLDPELSELGRRQSERLVERLNDIRPDAIRISPLRRAWQTFEIARATAPTVEFDSRLIEYGDYEPVLPVITPDIAAPDRHDAWRIGIRERTAGLLDELLANDEACILLFGHNGVFNFLCKAFGGDTRGDFYMHTDNAGVSRIVVDDVNDRVVKYWNDRSHVLDLL